MFVFACRYLGEVGFELSITVFKYKDLQCFS